MIRNPIHIITDADLEQNGGRWKLQGGAVIPVDHSTLAEAADDKLVAGSITPVYFVTAAQLATPRFKLMGGDDKRVYDGIVARGIRGGAAIPVYDPNYSAEGPWYDPNNEGLCIWAAYQPRGAASFAVSLVDLLGSGNDAIDPGGGATPPWDAINGWQPDGIADYLTTTFVPQNDQSQSVFVQFANMMTANGVLLGLTDAGAADFRIIPNGNVNTTVNYVNGGFAAVAPSIAIGGGANLGLAGASGYRNGVAEGVIGAWVGATARALYIAANNAGVAGTFCDVDIHALVIYDCVLTAPQALAVTTAMAAL